MWQWRINVRSKSWREKSVYYHQWQRKQLKWQLWPCSLQSAAENGGENESSQRK